MPILVDLTQCLVSNCVVSLAKDLKNAEDPINLIKHTSLTTLLSYKKKYGSEYGELILACDGREYWRKDFFPYYKGQRKHDREKSDLDWKVIFQAIGEIKEDLRNHFRFKIIEHNKAEADDVIAVMAKWFQSNELTQDGLFTDQPQKILVLSSDGDFVQLQKYPAVRQWSPIQKKFVVPKMKISEFINDHIAVGDGTDNVPNILTNDLWAKNKAEGSEDKVRQTPLKKERLEAFKKSGIDACLNDEERRNWQRNQTLVDFDLIPEWLTKEIVEQYIQYEVKGSRARILNYLMKNRMRSLIESVGAF